MNEEYDKIVLKAYRLMDLLDLMTSSSILSGIGISFHGVQNGTGLVRCSLR